MVGMQVKYGFLDRPQGILCLAFVTYFLWVTVTFLLEGRILTLLRPEAAIDRIVYTIIANIMIGSVLALLIVRHGITTEIISLNSGGFQPLRRTLVAVVIGLILGVLVLLLQHPASLDPVVFLNIYAQVFTVTVAEIAVCWIVVGSIIEGVLSQKGKGIAVMSGILLSSILFGIYHFAHSPPFNQPAMIGFLTIIGLVTGLVYFIGRDVYATIVFHNFFGCIGVMQSLSASGLLTAYSRPLVPVIGMAVLSFLVFAGIDYLYIRKKIPPI
ncbi:MAG: CPBP family intramembrane metalloprotease [Methanoregula sp.]|nr:MAG: CPBP family intramembrane metalloprotease [Methanoregula sp.]